MKAWCPSKKHRMTSTNWSTMNASVVVMLHLLVCATVVAAFPLILPIKAFVIPMRTFLISNHHSQAIFQLSMDKSNVNSVVTPLQSTETKMTTAATTTVTTTTTIQVCGSKDCTRRGGGTRLEQQIREVCECSCACRLILFY